MRWSRTWWDVKRSLPIKSSIPIVLRSIRNGAMSCKYGYCKATSGDGISSLLLGISEHSTSVGDFKTVDSLSDSMTKPIMPLPDDSLCPAQETMQY